MKRAAAALAAATASAVQDYFESVNVTVMGGVPTGWSDHPTPQNTHLALRSSIVSQEGCRAGCDVAALGSLCRRDLSRDSETDPEWAAVYRRFAVISPWAVGRYTSVGGTQTADKFLKVSLPAGCGC